jgi:hypothetical protein
MSESNQKLIDYGTNNFSAWRAGNEALGRKLNAVWRDSWVSDDKTFALKAASTEGLEILYQEATAGGYEGVGVYSNAVFFLSHYNRNVSVLSYGATMDAAFDLTEQVQTWIPSAERSENTLDVMFWYYTVHGPQSYVRQLQTPQWGTIESNYPKETRAKLESLQDTQPLETGGKLVLWQGQPGTGKTYALRALGEKWANWCKIHYVLDPEQFFANGDYLIRVILGGDDMPVVSPNATPTQPEWRLIVLEDAGELLAKDAKQQVGQGLSRLLNLCDGLLGQGLRVLVLITTNEEVGSLNAAVSRPGRCLSHTVFDPFDTLSANAWLKAHGSDEVVNGRRALADLYAQLNGVTVEAEHATAGFR